MRKLLRRKLAMLDRQVPHARNGPNEVWSMDFVLNALANGRRVKCPPVVDDLTRKWLDIAVDYGISRGHVARVLERIG